MWTRRKALLTRDKAIFHNNRIPNAAGQPCGLLFAEAIHITSLNRALRKGLVSWKKPYAPHDPAKVLLDLATIVILGGGALTGLDSTRDEPVI